jgi:hypothetical protein
MVMYPDVIAHPEEAFFQGDVKAQLQRFGDMVNKICKKYEVLVKILSLYLLCIPLVRPLTS